MGLVLQGLQQLGAAEEPGSTQEKPRCSLWVFPVWKAFPSLILHGYLKMLEFYYTANNVKTDGWSGSHAQTFPPRTTAMHWGFCHNLLKKKKRNKPNSMLNYCHKDHSAPWADGFCWGTEDVSFPEGIRGVSMNREGHEGQEHLGMLWEPDSGVLRMENLGWAVSSPWKDARTFPPQWKMTPMKWCGSKKRKHRLSAGFYSCEQEQPALHRTQRYQG